MENWQQRRESSVKFSTEESLIGNLLTAYEAENLVCYPEKIKEKRRSIRSDTVEEMIIDGEDKKKKTRENVCESIYPNDISLEKKTFTIQLEGSNSVLDFTIDNYVHVTHLVEDSTNEPGNFNLDKLATHLNKYHAEYSRTRKFTKVNLRYHNGPSHLIYSSYVIVETGSDNQALSRILLQKTISIIRDECGYPRVKIQNRKCQNIVSTARFNSPISLNVLKQRFPDTIYKKNFPGVVIKLRDLEFFYSEEEEYKLQTTKNFKDDDSDREMIRQINSRLNLGESSTLMDEEEVVVGDGNLNNDIEKWLDSIKNRDDYDILKLIHTEQNTTFLVFDKSQIICTGSKNEKELIYAYSLLYRLLDMCSMNNPKNQRLEKSLSKKI
jgi:TATA-box binding protein (TBP) (component of TFIID and TFIIIB)